MSQSKGYTEFLASRPCDVTFLNKSLLTDIIQIGWSLVQKGRFSLKKLEPHRYTIEQRQCEQGREIRMICLQTQEN